MSQLVERFRTYPPLLRWLIVALLIVAGIMLWQWLVYETAASWHAEADEYATAIERASASTAALNTSSREAILALGPIEPLQGPAETAQALSAEITRILSAHTVSGVEVKEKAASDVKGVRLSFLPPSMQVERLSSEVRFEASQEEAYAVIAELERSAVIESVSSVQIARSQDPRREVVVVQLTAEAWTIGSRGGRAGGATL